MSNKKEYVHLTHWDLDAVVSTILCKKAFNIKKSVCGGYGKVDSNIQKLIDTNIKNIVISDLNLTVEQFQTVWNHFDHIIYFDHHLPSQEIVDTYSNYKSAEIYYDKNISASSIVLKYIMKHCPNVLTKDIKRLTMLTEVYDMWRTEHKLWKKAFILNDMFWKHGFFEFENIYEDGFIEFEKKDIKYSMNILKDHIETIKESPKEEIGDDGLVLLLPDMKALNIVTLFYKKKYKAYYMLILSGDHYNGSLRLTDDCYNANDTIKKCLEKYPENLVSGGGHQMAGGFEMMKGLNINDALDFVHVMHQEMMNIDE